MTKLSVVERLMLSLPDSSGIENVRSDDLGMMGDGCCVSHGRVSSGSEYIKISFPCGHALPFDLHKEGECLSYIECPV